MPRPIITFQRDSGRIGQTTRSRSRKTRAEIQAEQVMAALLHQSVSGVAAQFQWEIFGLGAQGIAGAVMQSMPMPSTTISELVKKKRAGIPGSVFKAANDQIGRQAQVDTARAYDQRRGRRRGLPKYRIGQNRFSGGAMRRAIMHPGFYEATETELRFINRDIMSREAAQWKRLNFGAGRGAVTPPRQYMIQIGDAKIRFGLQHDPQPAFGMPPGIFIGAGGERQRAGAPGSGMFFPMRRGPMRETYGILAANFLDRGVKTIAEQMPPTYLSIYQQWYDDYRRSLPKGKQKTWSPPRMRVTGRSGPLPDIPFPEFVERGYIGRYGK